MRSIIDNKLASSIGFFTRTYKTKHTTGGSLLLQDRKKVSINILFQKVFLGWKLSSIINRREEGRLE